MNALDRIGEFTDRLAMAWLILYSSNTPPLTHLQPPTDAQLFHTVVPLWVPRVGRFQCSHL